MILVSECTAQSRFGCCVATVHVMERLPACLHAAHIHMALKTRPNYQSVSTHQHGGHTFSVRNSRRPVLHHALVDRLQQNAVLC